MSRESEDVFTTSSDDNEPPPSAILDAISLFEQVLNVEAVIGEEFITFEHSRLGYSLPLKKTALGEALAQLESCVDNTGGQLIDHSRAEFAVVNRERRSALRMRDEALELYDASRELRYTLGHPSLAFYINYMQNAYKESGDFKDLRKQAIPLHVQKRGQDVGFFEALHLTFRLTTLRIEAVFPKVPKDFLSLANSFYFHVGYNLDMAVTPLFPTESPGIIFRRMKSSRSGRDTLDAPHRTYIPDLVYSYQLALSSESPMMGFLSYYHIAEHWFEDIFLNDIADSLSKRISDPGFSYRDSGSLKKLIKIVSSGLRMRDEEYDFDERSALALTLQKYVSLPDLHSSLESHDPTLLEHYASNRVSFSDGPVVNLSSFDASTYAPLSKRIYATRNALVHRKSGNRKKFEPFRNDAELAPEVPLMRYVAEQIIINSGEPS